MNSTAAATMLAPVACADLVRCRRLSVARGGRTLISDVDLAVRPGEMVALVGPNGAGKSTLLHALAGEAPGVEEGEVAIADRPASTWRHRDLARIRALLPQRSTVAFPFAVHEVVQMGTTPWAGSAEPDEVDRTVARALDDTDALHLAERSYPTLSGGEQARVALARVLAQRTPLLLLDEPTAALDLGHQELVLALAKRHATSGGAAIVVLHDLGAAGRYADRVVLVDAGAISADGPPSQVLTEERISCVYRHPVTVARSPTSGDLIVAPERRRLDAPRRDRS
jgi:iron complex transport system ATP-binding protein